MTETKRTAASERVKELVAGDQDLMKALMKEALQEVLEAEMSQILGAGPSERTEDRKGYRSGYYTRNLVTRIGKLELRVPRDRNGEFSTALFERYGRSEKALVAALAEMYVQGVSTRKVKAITEELCGHTFSASAISSINKSLDAALARFAGRQLDDPYAYLILDARYEKVREDGVIRSMAVQVAIGINWEGQRQVLAVEQATRDLAAWITKWQGKYPKLVDWVESNIGETLSFYRLPRAHHKHLKSTNMLERLNEEIRRRTRVVRIFPNSESCLRLVRALCVETHETWLEDSRYLNMTFLAEQKKELLRKAA